MLEPIKLPLLRALALTPKQHLIREMILQLKNGSLDTALFSLHKFGVDVWQEFRPAYERLRQEQSARTPQRNDKYLRAAGLLEVDHFAAGFF